MVVDVSNVDSGGDDDADAGVDPNGVAHCDMLLMNDAVELGTVTKQWGKDLHLSASPWTNYHQSVAGGTIRYCQNLFQ